MLTADYATLFELQFELDASLDQGLISQQPLQECLREALTAFTRVLPVQGWVLGYEDHFRRPVLLSSAGDGWAVAFPLVEGTREEFLLAERRRGPRLLVEPLAVAGFRLGTLAFLVDSEAPVLDLALRQLSSRLDTHLYQHNAWSYEALKARGVQVLDAIFDSSEKLRTKLQEVLAWLVEELAFRGGFLLLPTDGRLQLTAAAASKAPRGNQEAVLEAAHQLWERRATAPRSTQFELAGDHYVAILLRPEPRPAEGLLLLYDEDAPVGPREQLADFFTFLLDSALQSTRLYNRSFAGFLEAMANVIDTFDPYTHGHSQRVASYAVALGAELELMQTELDLLWVAGILHDVGKVGVGTEILRQEGRLNPEQVNSVREHAALTDRILRGMSVDDFEDLNFVASSHHEREDGSGYPRGLKGEQIPLLTKVLSVADVFDAVTSDRPSHPGRSRDQGYAILREEVEAGRLNELMVTAFMRVSVWERIRADFQKLKIEAALGPLAQDAGHELLALLSQTRAALQARNAVGEDFCESGLEQKLSELKARVTTQDWSALHELSRH